LADLREGTGRSSGDWRTRWLAASAMRPDVLDQVASNRIDFPVIHGARVNLPYDEDQPLLFAGL
jgi:hypothetical protein